MSWIQYAGESFESECAECHTPFVLLERVWHQPGHKGLTGWGIRLVQIERAKLYCEDCGTILEYERAKKL